MKFPQTICKTVRMLWLVSLMLRVRMPSELTGACTVWAFRIWWPCFEHQCLTVRATMTNLGTQESTTTANHPRTKNTHQNTQHHMQKHNTMSNSSENFKHFRSLVVVVDFSVPIQERKKHININVLRILGLSENAVKILHVQKI